MQPVKLSGYSVFIRVPLQILLKNMGPMHKSIFTVIVCLALSACTRLGGHMERHALPSGAPTVETIMGDLASNDTAIKNFRATGTFVLKSPDLASTQLLRESAIQFRPPVSLYVVGRKYASTVFRLTTAGEKFLIEMPTEKQYYFSTKGERVKGISVDVSPSAIAKELFLRRNGPPFPQNT